MQMQHIKLQLSSDCSWKLFLISGVLPIVFPDFKNYFVIPVKLKLLWKYRNFLYFHNVKVMEMPLII